MSETTHSEAVEQSGNPIEELADWLDEQVEDLPDLPTPDEAELGQLYKVPEGQFTNCQLVDDTTKVAIDYLEEDELPSPEGATDEEVRRAVEAEERTILEQIEFEFSNLTEGE